MSRHQYIRNLDYQDAVNEYEGYSEEEEDELSPEDRVLMNQGTADVQAALGVEASKVTVAQIEEALWHYYYDLDKTVAYLISKFVNPRPKATKPAAQPPNGKSAICAVHTTAAVLPLVPGIPADWARKFLDLTDAGPPPPESYPASSRATLPLATPSFSLFFRDMPWGNIPKHRETTFIPPSMPRGGLLGGSGAPPKMSKLQALAAARKKKLEEASAANNKVDRAQADLNDLSIEDTQAGKENLPLAGSASKRLKTSESPLGGAVPVFATKPTPSEPSQGAHVAAEASKNDALTAEPSASAQALLESFAPKPSAPEDEPPVADPSAFASVLFGLPSNAPKSKTLEDEARAPKAQAPVRVEIDFSGPLYGYDGQGQPPEEPSAGLDWFDIRKRRRGGSGGDEEVVVLFPNLPQSAREAFTQPSPDDIVLAAQAKAKPKAGQKTAASQSKKKNAPSAATVTAGVNDLKIDDAPLPKSRNLDVLSEFERSKPKKSASFVVVGHVDAGKSTMMGRLLLDLKVIDQRAVDKLKKEAETIGKSSFALAWVLDQRSEERSRGVTIDIATNRFETEHTQFTILDAPGHRDFIPNMIAGASQADFAILVIDASTGAFESGLKGQTREHSLLIRSMGVSRIIVAINKLDTVSWSQERFDEIKDQMSGFLSSANFQHKNIAFVPVSGLRGNNLVQRSSDPAASWYTGPTLIEELENSEPNARALAEPLRMTVSEVYRTMQSPVTVAGRLDAGSLQMGDALLVQPSGEKAYVKSILADEAPVEWAVAGQNVALHLSHIDPIHVRVGDIICDPAKPIPRADTFTMKALAFDILMPMQVDVHRGRLHAAGRIETMTALLDKVSGTVTKKKPKIVKPAMVARIVVKLEAPVPLEAGQRVVLRSGGQTVAAGLLE